MGEFSASFRRVFSASFLKVQKVFTKIIKSGYTYDKSEKENNMATDKKECK